MSAGSTGRVGAFGGTGGTGGTVMWEAKANPGRAEELLAHVLSAAEAGAEIYRSADGRVVVIDPSGRGVAGVPGELLARAPHSWRFERVRREGTEG